MVADDRAYDEIVGLIYDSALDPLRLKHALAKMVEAVNATGAHLVGLKAPGPEVVLSAITGFSALGEIDYNERYAKLDPRAPQLIAAPVGRWIQCHQYLDQDFVDRSDFFQDFLIPYGSRYVSAVKLVESDSFAAILGVHTSIVQAPLPQEALDFLKRLTPHLERAVRLIHEYAQLQNQWSVVKATLDILDYGALVCDEDGVLLVGNASSAAMLEHADGLGLRDDRLYVHDATAREHLHKLLTSAPGEGKEAAGDALKGALLVPRPSGSPPYQIMLRRIEPARSLLGFAQRWLWSVVISDPASASVPTMRAIAMLYGLTPAETRLATLLISGAMPDEIAAMSVRKNALSVASTCRCGLKFARSRRSARTGSYAATSNSAAMRQSSPSHGRSEFCQCLAARSVWQVQRRL